MDEEDVGNRCHCTLLNSDGEGMGGAAEGLPGDTEKTLQRPDRRRLIFSSCLLVRVGAASKPPLLQLLPQPTTCSGSFLNPHRIRWISHRDGLYRIS